MYDLAGGEGDVGDDDWCCARCRSFFFGTNYTMMGVVRE